MAEVNSVRRFGRGTNSADNVLVSAAYVPVRLAKRPVADPSISRSPTSPTSLPMVKANRCSVSMVSLRAPAGANARASHRQDRAKRMRLAAEASPIGSAAVARRSLNPGSIAPARYPRESQRNRPDQARCGLMPHCIQSWRAGSGGTKAQLILLSSADIAISYPGGRGDLPEDLLISLRAR